MRVSSTETVQGLRGPVKAQEDKLEVVIAGIKPVLDYVGFEPPMPKGLDGLQGVHAAPPKEPSSMRSWCYGHIILW